MRKLLRNVICGAFILYGYNFIAVNFNMVVPINSVTLFMISILGTPFLLALVLFKVLIL